MKQTVCDNRTRLYAPGEEPIVICDSGKARVVIKGTTGWLVRPFHTDRETAQKPDSEVQQFETQEEALACAKLILTAD